MALVSTDPNASGFSSAVRDAWLKANHTSLFTQRSPFLKMLQREGRIQPSGYGINMREPLVVPVLTGPQLQGVNDPYAAQTAQPMTGYTTAEYNLSEYIINVSWSDYQDVSAGSPVEMVRWHEAHFRNAELRAFNTILSHIWGNPEDPNSIGVHQQLASIRTFINGGTTAATDGGALPSAQASQSVAPVVNGTGATAVTTVGKIPRAAAGAAYWCPCLLGNSSSATALTIQVLNDIYEEAFQDGGEEPTLILIPTGLYSKLTNLLTVGGSNGGQIYGESALAKVGFSAMRFRNAEIAVDRRVPTSAFVSGTSTALNNQIFCLGMKHLTLRMRSRVPKFKTVPDNRPIQQQVGQWFMALTADHLGNVHSMHFNITT